MAFCSGYGSKLEANASFCSKCGRATNAASAPLLAEAHIVETGKAGGSRRVERQDPPVECNFPSWGALQDKNKIRILHLVFTCIYLADFYFGQLV